MPFISTIPNANDNISTSQGQLRTNNLFLGDTSTRSAIAVVNGTSGNISTGGYYQLPNGLYIQYAKVTQPGPGVVDNTLISFITAFPNAVLSVILQPITGNTPANSCNVSSSGLTTTQFLMRSSTTFGSGIYYFAIGF